MFVMDEGLDSLGQQDQVQEPHDHWQDSCPDATKCGSDVNHSGNT